MWLESFRYAPKLTEPARSQGTIFSFIHYTQPVEWRSFVITAR